MGWEPYYIVDCISPYGTTGLSRFVVNEGENYEVTLNVPGKVSKTAPKLGTLGKATTENQIQIADVTEYQRPPNMITSSGYRLESYLSSSYGYRGTRDYTHIVEETAQFSRSTTLINMPFQVISLILSRERQSRYLTQQNSRGKRSH